MSSEFEIDPALQETLSALSMPDVYLRLRELMDSDDASMADVAEVLSLDPAMSVRVLRIANSAFYGFASQVEKISQAATILGMQRLHDIVLAASVAQAFDGITNGLMDINTFWYRSVHCGFLARSLGEQGRIKRCETLFVRGLLHDLGHLVLFSHYPEESRTALAYADEGFDARLQAEQRLIGVDAIQVTSALVSSWGLPQSYVDSYRFLSEPEKAPKELRQEISILAIAAILSEGVDSDLLVEQIIGQVPAVVWELAGVSVDAGSAALDASAMEMVEAMYQVMTSSDAGMIY